MGQKIVNNMAWRFAERSGAQAIEFIVTIILARLLGPDAYGNVALIKAFLSILLVFVEGGLGNALIQKRDADEVDFSSVFYFNILFCTAIYMALFFLAPYIADFYGEPLMEPMFRVSCVIILISGIKNVQQAQISRNMEFRKFFYATLAGTLISAIVGIVMALKGFGVWALIAQVLVNALVDTTVVWITVGWFPKKVFSFRRLSILISYGWKLLASNLLDAVYGNIRQFAIGKIYSASDLAFYNRGKSIPNVIVRNVNTSIDSVLFPVMSSKQDSRSEVKKITRKAIMLSNYVMAPLMMGMASMADAIVRILLTEKWMPCVLYLRIFCVIYMFQPIHTSNTNAIKSMGRGDLLFKVEVIKKTVGLIMLALSINCGMKAIIYCYLVNNIFDQIVNSWPNRRLLNYEYLEQMKDIFPASALAATMGVCVYCISFLNLNVYVTVLLQIVAGVSIYCIGSIALKLEAYYQLLDMGKGYFKKAGKEKRDVHHY